MRGENPAAQEHHVGPCRVAARRHVGLVQGHVAVGGQERGQVPRDGRVRGIGQAELLKPGPPLERLVLQLHLREEAVDQQLARFLAGDFELEAPADQPGAGAGHVDGEAFGPLVRKQRLLHVPAASHQHRPLARFQPLFAGEPPFDVLGQGQVEVIAPEDQVVAHGHPVKADLAPFAGPDADQREVGRPPADVADQDLLARLDSLVPIVGMRVDPGVERGLGLFDEHHAAKPRPGCRLDRQLPGNLVEGGRERQHEVLLGQRMRAKPGVPRTSDVLQVSRTHVDRGEPLHVGRPVPRQHRRRAVHARVTQPRLGRDDQPSGHRGPVIPGEEADRVRPVFAVPGKPQGIGRQLAGCRLVEKGGQALSRLDLPRRDQLRHAEGPHAPRLFLRVHVTDRGVGRPQVEPDDVAGSGALV